MKIEVPPNHPFIDGQNCFLGIVPCKRDFQPFINGGTPSYHPSRDGFSSPNHPGTPFDGNPNISECIRFIHFQESFVLCRVVSWPIDIRGTTGPKSAETHTYRDSFPRFGRMATRLYSESLFSF